MAESPPAPVPPSPEEQREYYHGLPSCPRLIARSSTDPWSPQPEPFAKALRTVGKHAIVDLWNDADSTLRRQILQAVEKVNWTAIDVLRVGYVVNDKRTKGQFTTAILISVKKDSISPEEGYDVVTACSRILESHGLKDVQVELKESEISQVASAPLPFSSGPPGNTGARLSECLGLSIAPSDAPTYEGTKCLCLRCGDKVFALTCRHVAFTDSQPNTKYQHDDTTAPRTIMQPGNTTWEKHKALFSATIKHPEESIHILRGLPPQGRSQAIRPLQTKVTERKALMGKLLEWDDPKVRVLGHVAFSPPFGLGSTEATTCAERLRDWALIELHKEKHATPLASLLSLDMVERCIQEVIKERTVEGSGAQFPFDKPTALVEDAIPDYEEGLFVMKHGKRTGLTTGTCSRAKSLTRRFYLGQEYVSEEWCIPGCRSGFSQEGDSGSCVFDLEGRIVGMLTGGTQRADTGIHDVSYATPMEWLLEDIKRHGYDVELF